ncbi:xanthine dehydrogenase YagR molybdenum-binding subunit [Lentzea fradiae]|uniref:Xanthine dehydrogenase YagR molybdenum-binding subunit n=1 Tax=Lentzea fradiae TaxID=200378 RepID=A0A1G7L1N9_9PSEU|nr:xanthine dehydrogenase family protein molybdopterin-binding subunit [Lentzea fradiae]SDF43398.1 xanthine dehydrogenase YagR molybdenum-binding subunit [Lentzea fradiae]
MTTHPQVIDGLGATPSIGSPRTRVEGEDKVSGKARYAGDVQVERLAHGAVVTATVARGRISGIDDRATLASPGVIGVIDHRNALRLNKETGSPFFGPDGQLQLLQDDRVSHGGQPVALVVAETPEQARAGAELLRVSCVEEPHDIAFGPNHQAVRPALTAFGPDADKGDLEAELAASAVVVDERYMTPAQHACAMEPHTATVWQEGVVLRAIDSNQAPYGVAATLATLFGKPLPEVRVQCEQVGGGFGSKTGVGPQLILATMAAVLLDRPVRVALTREEVFLTTSARPRTDQRVRLGADAGGRLRAIGHEATFEISGKAEFIENCVEIAKTLYAADAIRTRLSVVPLDILPVASVRAPGTAPGSFALESAMDELAERLEMDPLELRRRNEPETGPVSGLPFTSRRFQLCLTEGARRFGWAGRDHRPRRTRQGRLLVGTGMAGTSFLTTAFPSSATITAEPDGTFTVAIAAIDIGTGARTALRAIAADALGVGWDSVHLKIGDSAIGPAWQSGGSLGTTSWGWAIVAAARDLLARLESGPALPVSVTSDTTEEIMSRPHRERHSYSAVFAEVTVDPATGEVRVRRLVGRFAVGRVVNPLMVRSQLTGGMVMGLSIALQEEIVHDEASGRHVNADFADYHFAANADVPFIDADFVDDHEPDDPLGLKGPGEIGTVAVAAAIANAVWHATGKRQRELPIRLDRVIED